MRKLSEIKERTISKEQMKSFIQLTQTQKEFVLLSTIREKPRERFQDGG
jgi:hypothetical protein